MMVGRRRMEVGRVLSVVSIASKPRRVFGWLYTLTRRSSSPGKPTVPADTSLEEVRMGWIVGLKRVLTYMQDQGLEFSELSLGLCTRRSQPFCSLGKLVREFTGGSWRAMKRKSKLLISLNREYVTLWDRRQFSCRTAAEFGSFAVSRGCTNMEAHSCQRHLPLR